MLICSNEECSSDKIHKNGVRNGQQRYKCYECGTEARPLDTEDFQNLLNENVSLVANTQKFRDKTRISNKHLREYNRADNAVLEYLKELRATISENKLTFEGINFEEVQEFPEGSVGIVHLSDLHFNELVDIIGNKYDFKVASKRLKMFADKILRHIKGKELNQVYIVMTGDLLNSDRRIDELLSMATNRAQASFLATHLLSQFIINIAQAIPVKVIGVTGNESRIRDDYTQLDSMATDNFDWVIYEMLKLYLENAEERIEFISGNTFEYILSIHDINILIVHGHRLGKMSGTDLSKAVSKWAKKGVLIQAIMCGHLHETNITDTLLRTGSLVGNNAYSDAGLNLHSHASQNFYVANRDGTLDATKFDLQYVDDYPTAYLIDDKLEAYNAKSIDKLKNKRTIMEIVI